MKRLVIVPIAALLFGACQSGEDPVTEGAAGAAQDDPQGQSGSGGMQSSDADAAATPLKGVCCEPHEGAGCDDPEIEACVCELRPECCSGSWDVACVQVMDEKHCEPGVRACVCEDWQQTQCCDGMWDTFCRVTAEEKCGAAPSCNPSTEPAPATQKGPCCEASSTAGCSDANVEECVCALLPDCCTNAWDAICVQLVQEKHCEAGVRECVCEQWQQADCCDTRWTDFCAVTAEVKCGAAAACG